MVGVEISCFEIYFETYVQSAVKLFYMIHVEVAKILELFLFVFVDSDRVVQTCCK